MAKLRSVLGSGFSGRVGNLVGRKNAAGTGYVISSYQPNVANPKTAGQSAQRVKFALASKVAGCFPTSYLHGWGDNGLMSRAAFLRTLIRSAVAERTDFTGEPWRATLNPSSVHVSRGADFETIFSAAAVRPSLSELGLDFVRDATSGGEYAGIDVVVIIGTPVSTLSNYFTLDLYAQVFSLNDTQTEVTVAIPTAYRVSDAYVWVYAIEKRVSDALGSSTTGGAGNIGGEYANGQPIAREGSVVYGNSQFVLGTTLPPVQ